MDIKITVALIAAFVSFVGLLISKEQKVSEFRQTWIDRVRGDVAELIGNSSYIMHAWLLVAKDYKKNKKVGDKFLSDNILIFRDIDIIISRIKLSLNPVKDKRMMDALSRIEDATLEPSKINKLEKAVNEVERLSHVIFKTEWERVKSGEPFFSFSKWIVGLSIPALFIWLLYSWFIGA
ncbi:hypothetical protein [Aliivibrio fischeri]|uniref:hypothetical protein n=1 Tax=Aliivibrio fischeri TaxID=668 RepID=UPI00105D9C29|nr:hypothetical protein [Aliivibrio fischeri]TDM51393.1 hypothetical protein VFFQA001_14805 [Aliivibrio fischeri]